MKRYFLELFGTFALVFCGAGAIVMNDASGGAVTHVGIALTFGLIVMAMIYSIGAQSGAHINPAVTIAFWASGTFDKKDVFPYVAAQITGAVLASTVLYCLFPEHATQGATLPLNSYSQAFVIEVLLSFILMFVIVNVSEGSKETGKMAGIAIGGVVALEALFAGPITGASMNPARSIGPALFSGELQYLSLYSAAPIVGMLLATLFCKLTQAKAA
ncbi:aquaporin [Flavobacteriales bacterium]|nr:aquaporin [Flavobacteriales bacterium]